MRTLIIGCGYVGCALGEQLVADGHEVFGVRRSAAGASDLERVGIRLLRGDIGEPGGMAGWPAGCEWVVLCAASSGGGPEEYRRTYVDGTRHVLDWLRAHPPRKLVYTGSTGVYGQEDGEAVDETSPTRPNSETGRILVEAEQILQAAVRTDGTSAVILRLAGIYGPERGYWLRQFLSGAARIEGDGSRVVNMIHREDIVRAIRAAWERADPGSVWNVVDDEPASQLTVYRWLAERLNRPLPPALESVVPRGGKRRPGSKRVLNRRLRLELGVTLRYPTFREGYEHELRRLGH